MSNQLVKKIADEIREARQKKKISIDEIFNKTRIDKKYLNAIEDGNFSIMPDVYIRAFIKEFAKNVGLNPNEIIERYTLAQKGIDFEEPPIKSETFESGKPAKENKQSTSNKKFIEPSIVEIQTEKRSSDNKINKSFYFIFVAVLMIVFIFVIYKYFLTEDTKQIITEKPFEEIVQSQNPEDISDKNIITSKGLDEIEQKKYELINPTSSTEISNLEQKGNIVNTTNGLNLTIIGTSKSWVRVVSDEKDNMEFIIDQGITKVLNAKEKFYLHIGNSGGIKITLNNKDLLFNGSEGKVRKIIITKNGIEYLKRTPTFNEE
jgi:cytoskeletal protein RodZ